MNKGYTSERHVQELLALLKEHNIKRIIASPGTANLSFVISAQHDSWFEIYSCIDERSAAYLACGMTEETGEPVVITCTEATASRNYLPGLTEAYYRHLPILAVTGTHGSALIGHNIPQVIDRTTVINDVLKKSYELPIIKDIKDVWECNVKINSAILELKRSHGGPAHLNLTPSGGEDYRLTTLPVVRKINRIELRDRFPELNTKVAVYMGSHSDFDICMTDKIDRFCELYNAVVFCDHTSGYSGRYKVLAQLIFSQECMPLKDFYPDILIHIGGISAMEGKIVAQQTWRVSPDGEICDTFKNLRYVFECNEMDFFERYIELESDGENKTEYFEQCKRKYDGLISRINNIPFSNISIAKQLTNLIEGNATIYLSIYNSLRSWNFFEINKSIKTFSNVGGFGIDGGLSALVGASLINKDKLYFCIIGDLSFFYDMNVLGNRHLQNNLRILLINNNCGTEFCHYSHVGSQFGTDTLEYVAAGGHYVKNNGLVQDYAKANEFEYICADDLASFREKIEYFGENKLHEKSLIFEVITNSKDESEALRHIRNLQKNRKLQLKRELKSKVIRAVGRKKIDIVKSILK